MATAVPKYAQLFANAPNHYALYRPTYSPHLFAAILDFAGSSGTELAVDVATGSGQAAVPLAATYQKVLAIDASPQQLSHAQHAPNVEYQAADAHAIPLPDHTADLVTVAQALHWFDIRRFYAEARRVLKPSGCLAAWTYGVPVLVSQQHPAQQALLQLYEGVLGPYWESRRKLVEAGYEGMDPLPSEFGRVERMQWEETTQNTVSGMVGYVRSWSAYNTWLKQHPGAAVDPVDQFQKQLMTALDTQDLKWTLGVATPFTLLLAKEPVPP